jgi:hypothetical protein
MFMKIVLTAFNKKMWSKVIDVPDNTAPDFYMVMPMDVLAYNSAVDALETTHTVAKRGHWRRTNMFYSLSDFGITPSEGEKPSAAEYCLVDIS